MKNLKFAVGSVVCKSGHGLEILCGEALKAKVVVETSVLGVVEFLLELCDAWAKRHSAGVPQVPELTVQQAAHLEGVFTTPSPPQRSPCRPRV
jgi:hypothetical protein